LEKKESATLRGVLPTIHVKMKKPRQKHRFVGGGEKKKTQPLLPRSKKGKKTRERKKQKNAGGPVQINATWEKRRTPPGVPWWKVQKTPRQKNLGNCPGGTLENTRGKRKEKSQKNGQTPTNPKTREQKGVGGGGGKKGQKRGNPLLYGG